MVTISFLMAIFSVYGCVNLTLSAFNQNTYGVISWSIISIWLALNISDKTRKVK